MTEQRQVEWIATACKTVNRGGHIYWTKVKKQVDTWAENTDVRFAVEERMDNSENITIELRTAQDGEKSRQWETRTCDVWVDVFDTLEEAEELYNGLCAHR